MIDRTVVPEETQAIMADVSQGLFRSEEETAGARAASYAYASIAAPLQELIIKDPAAATALQEATSRIQDLPPLDNPAPGRLLEDHSSFQIRDVPYDYADKDHGAVHMLPDAATGKLTLTGTAGRVNGAPGDTATGICWTGIVVTNDSAGTAPGQTVRVATTIRWQAGWDLAVVGIPTSLVGANPWAECRAGVNLIAYDTSSMIAQHGPVEVLARHFDAAPGASWSHDSSGNGDLEAMDVYFSIPAGQARFVNMIAYINIRTNYSSVFNQAAAMGSFQATSAFMVLTPQ